MSTDANLMMAAADALREAAGARAKFPGNKMNHAATIEEVGEHAKALLENTRGKESGANVYAEAIQCAAMFLRLAVEGSAEHAYTFSPAHSRDFKATTPKPQIVPIVRDPALRPDEYAIASPALPPRYPRMVGGVFAPMPPQPQVIPYHGLTPPAAGDVAANYRLGGGGIGVSDVIDAALHGAAAGEPGGRELYTDERRTPLPPAEFKPYTPEGAIASAGGDI